MKKLIIFLILNFCTNYAILWGNYTLYQAKKGDNFYTIGREFHVNYLEIMKLNGNRPLRAGQTIKIPFYTFIKIKSGHTLIGISQKYKVTLNKILEINPGIKKLLVGQRLKLPISNLKGTPFKQIIQLNKKPTLKGNTSLKSNAIISGIPPIGRVPGKNNKINKSLKITRVKAFNPFDQFHFIWPATGQLMSSYGEDDAIMHYGLQIQTTRVNLLAMEKGRVCFLGRVRGLGMTIALAHGDGVITLYSGLVTTSLDRGDDVKRGQRIGKIGKILFFSIFGEGSPFDPIKMLG